MKHETETWKLNLILKLQIVTCNWDLKLKHVLENWNWNLKLKLEKVHNQLLKYVCFKFVNIDQLVWLKNSWIERFLVSFDFQYMDIGSRLIPNMFPSFLTYTDNFCFGCIVVSWFLETLLAGAVWFLVSRQADSAGGVFC